MRLLVLLVSCLALTACQGGSKGPGSSSGPQTKKPGDPTALAKIDDVMITVGEFEDRINKQSPYIRARYTSVERKKEFLDNLVRFETLAKEAAKRGYDRDEEVVRTMKQVMIQKLMKDEFDNRIKLEDIKDDECKKFYDEHKDEYNKPEEVRVSHILVDSDAKAKEALGKYRDLIAKDKAQDAKHFRDLVTAYSTDDTANKQRGGDLSFFADTTTQFPKEVVQAAFKLQNTGDVSPQPVKSAKGWHVLKLTGRRKALNRGFEEVKRQIQNRLYRDKRQKAQEDFVAELKKKANVQVYEDKLQNVKIDTTPGAPGAGAGASMPPGMPGAPGLPAGHPAVPPGMKGPPLPGGPGAPGMPGRPRMPGLGKVPGPAPAAPAPAAPAPAEAP